MYATLFVEALLLASTAFASHHNDVFQKAAKHSKKRSLPPRSTTPVGQQTTNYLTNKTASELLLYLPRFSLGTPELRDENDLVSKQSKSSASWPWQEHLGIFLFFFAILYTPRTLISFEKAHLNAGASSQ